MLLISLILFSAISSAQKLPELLTKHSAETLRYISTDGNIAYVKKNNSTLSLIHGYRSADVISSGTHSDFLVTDSYESNRLIFESIPNHHIDLNINKIHKLYVSKKGQDKLVEVGEGRSPQLHIQDDWISFYNPITKSVSLRNIITTKEYKFTLSKKSNSFFFPYYAMSSSQFLMYSDINDQGFATLNVFDLSFNKSAPILKASQPGTYFEICQNKSYIAVGEFPYEGIQKSSRILKFEKTSIKPDGYTTIYNSNDPDVGSMKCMSDSVYFAKTTSFDSVLITRKSEIAKINLKDSKISILTNVGAATQLITMDGRLLLPFREKMFVLEGTSNNEIDVLQRNPNEDL